MILTPLGKIKVYIDDTLFSYNFSLCDCNVKAVKDDPISACYKISVPCMDAQSVRCVIELDGEKILTGWDSDERYLGIDFYKNNNIVTIGAEADNPQFDTKLIEFGIEYIIKLPTNSLVFCVAWTSDYKGEFDIRTILATDVF